MGMRPARDSYDVVIVGGAIMGSAVAWFLTDLGFDGRVLVVDRDLSFCNRAFEVKRNFQHGNSGQTV